MEGKEKRKISTRLADTAGKIISGASKTEQMMHEFHFFLCSIFKRKESNTAL